MVLFFIVGDNMGFDINAINEHYALGTLTFGIRKIEIQDLLEFSREKLCGKILIAFKWILTGKGLYLKEETLQNLLLKNEHYKAILKKYPKLESLLKTHQVAIHAFENQKQEMQMEPLEDHDLEETEDPIITIAIEEPAPLVESKEEEKKPLENDLPIKELGDQKTEDENQDLATVDAEKNLPIEESKKEEEIKPDVEKAISENLNNPIEKSVCVPEPEITKVNEMIHEAKPLEEEKKNIEEPKKELEQEQIAKEMIQENPLEKYPGQASQFQHYSGDWKPNPMKILSFSTNQGSIRMFGLYEGKVNSLSIWLMVKKSDQKMIDFFQNKGFLKKNIGLNFPLVDEYLTFSVRNNLPKLKEMFQIIKENNQIPDPYLVQLNNIINEYPQLPIEKKIEIKPEIPPKNDENNKLKQLEMALKFIGRHLNTFQSADKYANDLYQGEIDDDLYNDAQPNEINNDNLQIQEQEIMDPTKFVNVEPLKIFNNDLYQNDDDDLYKD